MANELGLVRAKCCGSCFYSSDDEKCSRHDITISAEMVCDSYRTFSDIFSFVPQPTQNDLDDYLVLQIKDREDRKLFREWKRSRQSNGGDE